MAKFNRLANDILEVIPFLCRKGEVLKLDLPSLKAQLKKEYF